MCGCVIEYRVERSQIKLADNCACLYSANPFDFPRSAVCYACICDMRACRMHYVLVIALIIFHSCVHSSTLTT